MKKSTNCRLGVDINKLGAINCSTHESFAHAERESLPARVSPTQVFPGQRLAGGLSRCRQRLDVDHRGNQVTSSTDDRSPLAKAYQWSTRIMVVALEMVLPGMAGFWVDRRIGTVCVFLLIGVAAGCTFGIRHVIRLATKTAETIDRG